MITGLVRTVIVFFWVSVIAAVLLTTRIPLSNKRAITVLAWDTTFSRDYVQKFEKATGIKVYLSYYSTNEELLVKLRATQGQGYDLVVPSDYAVEKLIKEGLLKKIDKQRLSFFKHINPLLLHHYYDPTNEYSIPFEWGIYLIGINKHLISPEVFRGRNAWDFVYRYQPDLGDYRIIMVNDSVEVIYFAAHYLFGNVVSLDPEQTMQVQELLVNQKRWVEAYTSLRADYLLRTNIVPLAVVSSSELWRAAMAYPYIDFVVPDETFITIENCVIPRLSTKDDLVYEFLNFFYTKEAFMYLFNEFFLCPVRTDVIDELPVGQREKNIIRSSAKAFEHYHFIRELIPEEQRMALWVAVKS